MLDAFGVVGTVFFRHYTNAADEILASGAINNPSGRPNYFTPNNAALDNLTPGQIREKLGLDNVPNAYFLVDETAIKDMQGPTQVRDPITGRYGMSQSWNDSPVSVGGTTPLFRFSPVESAWLMFGGGGGPFTVY